MTSQSTTRAPGGELSEHALKFVILLGLTPAIMTSLIAPRFWYEQFLRCFGDCAPERLIEPLLGGLPVYTALAAVAFALGLGLAIVRQARWRALLLIPLLLFFLRRGLDMAGDGLLQTPPDGDRYFLGEWLYNVSTSVVFICLALSPRRVIRTPVFGAFVVLLVLAMIVEPHFGLGEWLFFLASFAVVRIVVNFIRENWALFARIGMGRTAVLLGKSLVLMTPILVLIGFGEVLRQKVETVATDAAYANCPLVTKRDWLPESLVSEAQDPTAPNMQCTSQPENEEERRKQLEKKLLIHHQNLAAVDPCRHLGSSAATSSPDSETGEAKAPPDLERDLCYYTEFLYAGVAEATNDALLKSQGKRYELTEDIRRGADDAVETAMPHVSIYDDSVRCEDFPWLPCELKQGVLYITENALNGAIDRARSSVVGGVNKATRNVEEVDEAVTKAVMREVDDTVEQLRLATRAVLANGFDLLGIFDRVLLLLLVLAFLKSLLFIFARVVFTSVDPDAVIEFAEPGAILPRGDIKVQGKRYTLTGEKRVCYARQAQVEGIAPSIALPQPFACVLNRLLSGVYLMNRADPARAPEGRIVFKTGDVRQFVEWDLADGEEVVFHFKDFIAADQSVKFSTFASFRIPTLLMGRLLYRVAAGPGRLILRTDGAAETVDEADATLSKPVHRVVAWHRAARFKLEAEQSFADIYLSGVHVKMTPGDMVVFVAEAGDRRRVGTGAVRFLKNFILPV